MDILSGKNVKKAVALLGFSIVLYLAFKCAFPVAAPFILSFFIVYLCNPWLKKVQKRLHIRKEILLGGILLLAAALLVFGGWGIVSWGTVHAADIGNGMAVIQARFDEMVHGCCIFMEENFGMDATGTENAFWEKMNLLTQNLQAQALPKAASQSWQYVKGFAGTAAFLGVSFISSLLLCKDYEAILERCGENPVFAEVWKFVEKTGSLVGGYLKAQAVILLAISVIAVLGLWLGRVRGGLLLGILAGLLDALPFIGTGIVLLPTALWQLLSGNGFGAVAAVGVYVICIAVRELLEPRLLGKQVGMYPIVMLFSVYAGVQVFGLTGIFLGPLYVVFFREGVDIAETLLTNR